MTETDAAAVTETYGDASTAGRGDAGEPRVAVVIVNYNAAATLPATLDGLRPAAEAGDLDVLVVDNGSTDGSAELVAGPLRLIRAGQNLGFARGSNLGWAQTGAELVLFLNPDAKLSGTDVLRLAGVFGREPGVGAGGPRIVDETGRRDPHCTRRAPTVAAFLFQVTGLAKKFPESPVFGTFFDRGSGSRDVACLSGACMMVRRAAVADGPPFDERFFIFGEDLDLCLRIGRAGYRVTYVDEVVCNHVGGHSMGQVVPHAVLEGYRSWVILLAKDRGPAAAVAAWLVAVLAAAAQLLVWLAVSAMGGARRRPALARAKGSVLILQWAFGLRKGGVAW